MPLAVSVKLVREQNMAVVPKYKIFLQQCLFIRVRSRVCNMGKRSEKLVRHELN